MACDLLVFVITSHGPNVDEDSEFIAQRNTVNISTLKFPPSRGFRGEPYSVRSGNIV